MAHTLHASDVAAKLAAFTTDGYNRGSAPAAVDILHSRTDLAFDIDRHFRLERAHPFALPGDRG